MEKEQAHRLYRYWMIAINRGQGFNTFPENFGLMLKSAARNLQEAGHQDLSDRLLREWNRKSGVVYGRYYSRTEINVDNDVNAEHAHARFPEEEVAAFKERFQKWLQHNSDPLTVSTEAYRRRVKERLAEEAAGAP